MGVCRGIEGSGENLVMGFTSGIMNYFPRSSHSLTCVRQHKVPIIILLESNSERKTSSLISRYGTTQQAYYKVHLDPPQKKLHYHPRSPASFISLEHLQPLRFKAPYFSSLRCRSLHFHSCLLYPSNSNASRGGILRVKSSRHPGRQFRQYLPPPIALRKPNNERQLGRRPRVVPIAKIFPCNAQKFVDQIGGQDVQAVAEGANGGSE